MNLIVARRGLVPSRRPPSRGVSGRRATSLRLSLQGGAKRRTRHPDDLAHLHRRLGSGFALARAPRKDDAE
jgi:hypothetical protein